MTEILNTILDEQSKHENDKPNYALRRSMALSGAALSLVGGFVAIKAVEHVADRIITPIEYSQETTTYTVKSNEGLDAVTSNVAGIEDVDFSLVKSHISTMPENVGKLVNGVIPLNTTYVLPAEVKQR